MIDELSSLYGEADVDGNGSLDKAELLSLFSRINEAKPRVYPHAEVRRSNLDPDPDTLL